MLVTSNQEILPKKIVIYCFILKLYITYVALFNPTQVANWINCHMNKLL